MHSLLPREKAIYSPLKIMVVKFAIFQLAFFPSKKTPLTYGFLHNIKKDNHLIYALAGTE